MRAPCGPAAGTCAIRSVPTTVFALTGSAAQRSTVAVIGVAAASMCATRLPRSLPSAAFSTASQLPQVNLYSSVYPASSARLPE